ncbi:IS5 family transposase [Gluconobacter oxydans]|uniref:Transposase n=1 Tax=Gluconobacter oxydans NBRC 3293 TaxID=1315969 RepID=A0A829X077_GLUOY|nr:hypothetical protein NBRC3293_0794 [Gluconobacter oxydans NBRC 3293]
MNSRSVCGHSFPKSHGRGRVDERRALSDIIFVKPNGLRWRDTPREYGPHKTLHNCWKKHWGAMGMFARMMDSLAAGKAESQTLLTDAKYLISQGAPHGFEPAAKKGDPGRLIGRTKGGMNTKLHAITDQNGRPLSFFMTAGQISDYTGATALLEDRGYDADWFRDALDEKGIKPCIPERRPRGRPVKYDKRKYKRRHRIEIMFGRLKG